MKNKKEETNLLQSCIEKTTGGYLSPWNRPETQENLSTINQFSLPHSKKKKKPVLFSGKTLVFLTKGLIKQVDNHIKT